MTLYSRMLMFSVLCLLVLSFAAGCGSAPVKESAVEDPSVKRQTTRDEIKKSVDSATEDLDKSLDGVEIKTNAPAK